MSARTKEVEICSGEITGYATAESFEFRDDASVVDELHMCTEWPAEVVLEICCSESVGGRKLLDSCCSLCKGRDQGVERPNSRFNRED